MRITINLATRPFTDLGPILKRLRIVMGVCAGVSLLLGVGLYLLHHKAEQARARNHSLDGNIARITTERQGYEAMMQQPQNAQVLNEAATLNQLIDEKTFSWTLAMEDLETVLPGGVQVTTLEPIRDKEGHTTLRLRVVGPRDKNMEFLTNLEHSKYFIRPTLVGESAENGGGPGQPLEPVSASNKVDFDMLAEYNTAAIQEHPPVLKAKEADQETEKSTAASHPAPAGAAHTDAGPGAAGTAAAGPGLRRPPLNGAMRPSNVPPSPAGAGAQQSPATPRPAGARRYPPLAQHAPPAFPPETTPNPGRGPQ